MWGYSYSKEDFLDLLIKKYTMEEKEQIWCLWLGEQITDYQLCNGDSDLLPPLVKKDEIRYEYNQWAKDWSRVSCTIFAAMWMLSDLINYEFSEAELKEVDELSYTRWRIRGQWWYVQSAVKLVADRYNESDLSKKYGKIAYFRISKYDDDILEWVINKLYTIDWNHWLDSRYTADKKDWMIDGTDFWSQTNWHSVDIICKWGQRSVKNSYKWAKNNIYGLKNKLSAITNFWTYFYVYTLVGDNLEEVKRLNEMKTECLNCITSLWKIWHLTNEKNFQEVLHYTANKLRDKVKTCDEMLLKLK